MASTQPAVSRMDIVGTGPCRDREPVTRIGPSPWRLFAMQRWLDHRESHGM